jgi:hypothetical protein
MIIYRNRASGKYFIHIKDLTEDEALFVLPVDDKDGKSRIKSLELELFDEAPEEGEDKVLLEKRLISEKQLEKYKQHREAVETSLKDQIVEITKLMTSFEKDKIKKKGGIRAKVLELGEELIENGWDEE